MTPSDFVFGSQIARKHTWLLAIRTLLGEEVTSIEWTLARNRDTAEYTELAQRTEELEQYIQSDMFTSSFDVKTAEEKAKAILDEGYKKSAIQYSEIEGKCLKILEDITAYIARVNPRAIEEARAMGNKMEDMPSLYRALGFLRFITLNDELKTSESQRIWHIFAEWLYPEWHMLSDALESLHPDDAKVIAADTEELLEHLVREGRLERKEGDRIRKQIKTGLEKGLRLHPQKL